MMIDYSPVKKEQFQEALDKHNIGVSADGDDALGILCGLISGILDHNAELVDRLEKVEKLFAPKDHMKDCEPVKGNRKFCINGHPLIGNNVYVTPATGARACKICRKANKERHTSKRKKK